MPRKLQGIRGLILVLLGLAVPTLAGAQRPFGPPFTVNAQTEDPQGPTDIAMSSRGEFVVTWETIPPTSAERRTILARRFAADGTPVTGEILVTDDPLESNLDKAVMMDDGSFFVVLPQFPDLVARRYGPDGSFEGESVVAHQVGRSFYSVAPRPRGGFVLAFARENLSLFTRIVGADGEPDGPERRFSQTSAPAGGSPVIAAGPDGGFVVSWIVAQEVPDQPHIGDYYLFAQRFDANGAPVGGRIPVQGRLRGILNGPRIAEDQEGNFLILWKAGGILGTGRNREVENGVLARRFAADGTPRTGLLRLVGPEAQSLDLAMDRAGNFVVAWAQPNSEPQGIIVRRFTADGAPFRQPIPVDTKGSGPLVASDANGNFTLVWSGLTEEVLAQRFRKR
jgi:hypothetical protein